MKYLWICIACLHLAVIASEEAKPEPVFTEAMVVTATKEERKLVDLPASVTVLDADQLEQKAASIAGEAVAEVPGVFLRRDGAGSAALSINIRGLTGVHGNDTFLALLDGIPFVSAHEEVLLSELPIGATDKIEVIRGPVSALYGRGALSGAINYITRSPKANREVSLDLRGDSQGHVRPHLSASLPVGSHNLLIDGYTEHHSGWRDGTERDAANILIKDEITLSSTSRLTAYANIYQSEQGAGGQIPLDANGEVIPVAGGRTGFIGFEPNTYDRETMMLALRHNWILNENLELETTAHYRNLTDNNVLGFFDSFGFDPENNILRVNGFENDRDTDVLFFEPRLTWKGARHTLTAGLNWERVELDETDWWTGQNGFNSDTFEFYFYEINIDYTTGEILNRDHPFWVDRNEAYRGSSTNEFQSAYFQDEWQVGDRTRVTFGLRYDSFQRDAQIDSDVDFDGVIDINPAISDDASHVSPKFALHHHFNEALSGYLSYGEGFNSNFGAVWQWDPSLYQRGSEVEPSVVRSYEIGAKGSTDRLAYSLSVYNMIQQDRLVFVSNPDGFGPPIASTADEFESSGLELEGTLFLNENWSTSLGYAHIDAEWNDYVVGGVDLSGKQPLGVPENTVSLGLRGKLSEQFQLWGSYQINGDYFVTLDNSVSGGDHELLDIGLGYTIPKLGARINLVGKNILDEDFYYLFGSNNPMTATPGLPARVMLSVGFDFGR